MKKGHLIVLEGIDGCVDEKTQYFNGEKWKYICDYSQGERVLQYNEDGTSELVLPSKYHIVESKNFIKLKRQGIDQVLTPNHNVVYASSKLEKPVKIKAEEVLKKHQENKYGFNRKFITTFGDIKNHKKNHELLTEMEVRVMVAVIADGTFPSNTNNCYINVKKEDKKLRIRGLLKGANIPYKEFHHNEGYTKFGFYAPVRIKEFPMSWIGMPTANKIAILDEIVHWDGNLSKPNGFKGGTIRARLFHSTNKKSIDFIQFISAQFGFRGHISTYHNPEKYKNGYMYTLRLNISNTPSLGKEVESNKNNVTKIEGGKAYCFTVPSGMLIFRRNNVINITGNSGKDTQAQLIQKEYGGVITRLPFYENITGKAILEANLKMKEGMSEEAYQTLMAANYIEHLDSFIMKHINAGENVIMTRFLPSMIAYGRYFSIDEGLLGYLLHFVTEYYSWSIGSRNIHMIHLKLPVEESLKRIRKRDEETDQKIQPLFEKEDILRRVEGEYNIIPFDERVNSNKNIDEVFADIKAYLDNNM